MNDAGATAGPIETAVAALPQGPLDEAALATPDVGGFAKERPFEYAPPDPLR